jgi:hypothetical protein
LCAFGECIGRQCEIDCAQSSCRNTNQESNYACEQSSERDADDKGNAKPIAQQCRSVDADTEKGDVRECKLTGPSQ